MTKTLLLAGVVALAIPAPLAAADMREPARTNAPQATATLTVRTSQFGRILFDGRGRALYAFTRDRRKGPSTCYGACATAWPVYFAKSALRAGANVKRSLIGTVRRRDGRRQITYNGWPLYYYAHEGPREVKCQNVDQFGGLWLVVRPSGALVR
jgi:predicted lipoprotein with Yx(FWY)xxD motif